MTKTNSNYSLKTLANLPVRYVAGFSTEEIFKKAQEDGVLLFCGGGKFTCPPAPGTRVVTGVWGKRHVGTVTGYFHEAGFVGVNFLPDVRPECWKKQGYRGRYAHLMGTEIALEQDEHKPATPPAVEPKGDVHFAVNGSALCGVFQAGLDSNSWKKDLVTCPRCTTIMASEATGGEPQVDASAEPQTSPRLLLKGPGSLKVASTDNDGVYVEVFGVGPGGYERRSALYAEVVVHGVIQGYALKPEERAWVKAQASEVMRWVAERARAKVGAKPQLWAAWYGGAGVICLGTSEAQVAQRVREIHKDSYPAGIGYIRYYPNANISQGSIYISPCTERLAQAFHLRDTSKADDLCIETKGDGIDLAPDLYTDAEGEDVELPAWALDAKLQREVREVLHDVALFLRNRTPLHPGSDLANNLMSLERVINRRPQDVGSAYPSERD